MIIFLHDLMKNASGNALMDFLLVNFFVMTDLTFLTG